MILESIEKIAKYSKRCIQLYSGGLDSNTFALLAKQHGIEVIALHVELGPETCSNKFNEIVDKLGINYRQIDLIDNFVENYIAKAILANAKYKGIFPVCSSLSRPLMVETAITVARAVQADTIVHTAGYEQNTAHRFNQSIRILAPDLNIGCPFIHNKMTRKQKQALLKDVDLLVSQNIYSIDENLWGRVIECGELDNPSNEVSEKVFLRTENSCNSPVVEKKLVLDFKKGLPIAIDGNLLSLRTIIERLNHLGMVYGVGRFNGLEDTVWEVKNHEVREAPAAAILLLAHAILESSILTQRELRNKHIADEEWTDLIVNGYWHTPLKNALQNLIETLSEVVTGKIGLCFTPGQVFPYSIDTSISPHFYNGGAFIQDQFSNLNYSPIFEIKSFGQRFFKK